ncbi:hypothetical protein Ahy_B01g055371 isoform B [Arachis hypogaea]|uniref:Uncharacterized protein n=1 Tax=Arachis hypogaea TaxID=3818 RepID=A0A445AW75_ARAHY|nr:hypothetical protein Ahy_B01g055371 isoform B [Arachis hypogaea]
MVYLQVLFDSNLTLLYTHSFVQLSTLNSQASRPHLPYSFGYGDGVNQNKHKNPPSPSSKLLGQDGNLNRMTPT